MKTLKTTTIIAMMLLTLLASAQDKISVALYQDVKLALAMDAAHGNKNPTADAIINVNLEGKQFNWYYFKVQLYYEYANLNEANFNRYGVNTLWTFNQLIVPKMEANLGLGFGFIKRGIALNLPDAMGTISLLNEMYYPVSPKIKISIKNELVHRSDLKLAYNDNVFLKYNFSIGIQADILR